MREDIDAVPERTGPLCTLVSGNHG